MVAPRLYNIRLDGDERRLLLDALQFYINQIELHQELDSGENDEEWRIFKRIMRDVRTKVRKTRLEARLKQPHAEPYESEGAV